MEKDKATEYWANEIKRAEEDSAKAYAEFQRAKKAEARALKRYKDVEVNDTDTETKEEAREIYRRKSIISSQKSDAYLLTFRYEGITREAAEGYKKRKAEKEANKQESTQSRGRRQ